MQVIAFNELHKFPAIGLQTCARCFELEEDGSLKHPQYVSGDVAQRCIKEFQMATSDAASGQQLILEVHMPSTARTCQSALNKSAAHRDVFWSQRRAIAGSLTQVLDYMRSLVARKA